MNRKEVSSIMETSKNYKCCYCSSSFVTKDILKQHEDNNHKVIQFKCQYCGKQFMKKSKLTVHMNSIHKGIKYKCDQCEKEFKQIAHRNTQEYSH